MVRADLAPLMPWLSEQLQRGCTPGSLIRSMTDSGWALDDAAAALLMASDASPVVQGAVAGSRAASTARSARPAVADDAASAQPELKAGAGNVLQAADRQVRVILEMASPRVVVVADLLSDQECEELIDAAQGRLHRSQTVSAHEAQTAEVNAARTSEGMFFQRGEIPVVARLEARIADLLGWPEDQAEGLQVLRYAPGAEYRPHFDHFDMRSPGGQLAMQRGGQRVGTVVVYLATPGAGGATIFPDQGLSVRAQTGHAVFFGYDLAGGAAGVLHGGAPVVQGEKWVATKWLREKKYV